jgi:hypothetical protein
VRLLFWLVPLRKTPVFASFVDIDGFAQDEMAQCPDAHLFCKPCVGSYADVQLGQQSVELVCMDGSGCKAPFSETELRRVLDRKAMQLYDRLSARSNLEKAKIAGLEACPFCKYQYVIEIENEKLFRCRWEGCMKVSCRACKKPVSCSTTLLPCMPSLIFCYRIIGLKPVMVCSGRLRRRACC